TLRHEYLAETLHKREVDFPRQWLVVSPATHFLMGGIVIDESAASSLPGLYAVGESAGGIHGANRLGGNAFCEGLVFGTIAGQAAADFARASGPPDPPTDGLDHLRCALDPTAADPRKQLSALWLRLRETMWEKASVVREAQGLAAAA